MPIITLNDHSLPALIYGTAWKQEKTASLVEKALLHGFRGVDTACQPKHYHEAGVGEALQHAARQSILRRDLFVQTKFTPPAGQDLAKTPYERSLPIDQQVQASFKVSLANLQVTFIDALLLHSPLPTYAETMSAWHAMEEIYQQGGVRLLGISNCYELAALKHIYQEATVKPSIVQNRFYKATNYDKDLRAWCLEKGIFYQAFWTLTANEHVLAQPLFVNHALDKGVSEAQLFYRYLTQKQMIPLIGTTDEKHMLEDVAIFDFSLSPKEIEAIDSLLV